MLINVIKIVPIDRLAILPDTKSPDFRKKPISRTPTIFVLPKEDEFRIDKLI